MSLLIAISSILLLTGLTQLVNQALKPRRICPICAGVSATWIWITLGIYLGWLSASDWILLAAIGMGGSVVGIAYLAEKRVSRGLLWKILFIPTGFAASYSLLEGMWSAFLLSLALAAILLVSFLRPSFKAPVDKQGAHDRVEKLEKELEDCC
ncbi:MAG: hypothetical protein HYY99_00380 [Candidatus Colwellbacteria bacterium]|nr:hypothetical protein [Candidatus Colwellbacteria bacterium]MBI3088711.1 hypothetical protein [Candidatus Colwellbacteria bacterium]